MTSDPFEDRLREAAEAYHPPPEPPREEMWRAIQRRRGVIRTRRRTRWTPWVPLAAAALLALGVGIGRVSSGGPALAPPTRASAAERGSAAYRLATLEHLGQSEEFLTLFRRSLGAADPRLASAAARRLLGTNRLLLDSQAALDPETRRLLEDLELVLAGIAQLSERPRAGELELIVEGLHAGNVMPRLRTAAPPRAAPPQGAL